VGSDFLCLEGAKNLKALTGGDSLSGEIKFSNERVDVKGDKQVLITTNHVLRLVAGGDVEAWRRRLIVFEARKCLAETLIVNFAEVILSEERDAVFSKLMNAGYQASVELKRDGRLTIPERYCLGGCSGVVVLGDVGTWVGERVRPGEAFYATKDLFLLYSEWCRSRGEHPTSRTVFDKSVARLFADLGIESSHSLRGANFNYCNGYRGLEVIR
jgi:phage/plasmid-associated DNA primase